MIKLSLMGLMAIQYLSIKYQWGGKDHLGFDCSGLVEKVLHDVGKTIPRYTAQEQYRWALNQESGYSSYPERDSLLFFGKSTEEITHVAIALSGTYMIEAGGAGRNSLEMTDQELAHRDARVRIKPISSRKDLVASVLIRYKGQDQ